MLSIEIPDFSIRQMSEINSCILDLRRELSQQATVVDRIEEFLQVPVDDPDVSRLRRCQHAKYRHLRPLTGAEAVAVRREHIVIVARENLCYCHAGQIVASL